jgi:hypothetical protein
MLAEHGCDPTSAACGRALTNGCGDSNPDWLSAIAGDFAAGETRHPSGLTLRLLRCLLPVRLGQVGSGSGAGAAHLGHRGACGRHLPGPPIWRSVRTGGVGSRPAYLGPLPRSCSCGQTHPRRRAEKAAASEPLEPEVSRILAARIRDFVEPRGPAALAGGEDVALSLLVGPPRRGAPVSSSARISWRPLDLYIGRNSRLGDPVDG